MSCGIYKITNKQNNKCYIGQSVNIENRWVHHRNFNKNFSNYPLYQAFVKYGIENFSWEILEECKPSELDEKEIYYISLYNSYNNGYNQTTGGSGSSNLMIKLSNEDVQIIYDLLLNSKILQNEIAEMFHVGIDTISEINQGKTRINENLSYPLRKNSYKVYCANCGKEITHGATYCSECNRLFSRIVERPSREDLKNQIRNNSFVSIAKKYGVTDNSIRKWCKTYNLPFTKKVIKQYSDIDWNNV